MAMCQYCSNAVYWDAGAIQSAGQQSSLPEGFSRLYRGAAGTLMQKRFVVLGRVRYSFGHGFWDEWFVELEDGAKGWLTEDDHELALEFPAEKAQLPGFASFAPGQSFQYAQSAFMVEEVGHAECLGFEGTLPIVVQTGERYPYVDASSPDGQQTLGIEFDEQVPTVFRGRWLAHAELRLDEEGGEW